MKRLFRWVGFDSTVINVMNWRWLGEANLPECAERVDGIEVGAADCEHRRPEVGAPNEFKRVQIRVFLVIWLCGALTAHRFWERATVGLYCFWQLCVAIATSAADSGGSGGHLICHRVPLRASFSKLRWMPAASKRECHAKAQALLELIVSCAHGIYGSSYNKWDITLAFHSEVTSSQRKCKSRRRQTRHWLLLSTTRKARRVGRR